MTEFVLVRHGETDWNTAGRLQGGTDTALNDLGISQARALGAMLCAEHWDVVVSSPLQRAFETAVQIIDPLGLRLEDIVIDPRVRERGYGAAEGLTLAERQVQWPDDVWPDAETTDLLDARSAAAMHELAANHAGKRIVVVAHGGFIRSVLRVLSDYDPAIMHIHIPNASCTFLAHDGERWHLGEHGVIDHLATLANEF